VVGKHETRCGGSHRCGLAVGRHSRTKLRRIA
jgi:hypothetical protein